LFSRIQCDSRHHNVVLLHYGEITERRYPAGPWDRPIWTGSTRPRCYAIRHCPYRLFQLPGSSSMALVDELIASASVLGRA
jgi:hypothetical protein